MTMIRIILATFITTVAALLLLYNVVTPSQLSYARILSGATFPPPLFYQLRNIPSYAITIPFSSLGKSSSAFDPMDVSVPVGMTIIWFNDDNAYHTVTTAANSTYSPPVKFDSNFIPMNGGSYIHTFSKQGIYDYYDKQHPSMHGRVYVGTGIELGKNMNMMIGGKIPFNPNESRRVVLSFIPKNLTIPPRTALTYQVTISDPLEPWLIFSHRYDDSDGILDLELIPTHKSLSPTTNSTDFITWGPDFRSQESIRSTGTFHIKGPILVENSQYNIRIAIIARDGSILSKPIADTFALHSQATVALIK
jgi:hypothetical protein